jgi:hypothetical protein
MLHDCVGQEDFRRGYHLCFDQRYRHVENMSPARGPAFVAGVIGKSGHNTLAGRKNKAAIFPGIAGFLRDGFASYFEAIGTQLLSFSQPSFRVSLAISALNSHIIVQRSEWS